MSVIAYILYEIEKKRIKKRIFIFHWICVRTYVWNSDLLNWRKVLISFPLFRGKHFWQSFGDRISGDGCPLFYKTPVSYLPSLSVRIEACRLLNYLSIQCHLFVPQVGGNPTLKSEPPKINKWNPNQKCYSPFGRVSKRGRMIRPDLILFPNHMMHSDNYNFRKSFADSPVSECRWAGSWVLDFLRFGRHSEGRLFILARCHCLRKPMFLWVCVWSRRARSKCSRSNEEIQCALIENMLVYIHRSVHLLVFSSRNTLDYAVVSCTINTHFIPLYKTFVREDFGQT